MDVKAVGLLSPGDMGHVVGRRLIEHDMPVLTCLKGRSERTRGLAEEAGIKDVPTYENLVCETDMILSIMVPGEAVNAAKRVAVALVETGETTVFADCNAVAPATGRELDGIIRGVGSRYVDAAIINRGEKAKFYASGPDAEALMALRDYGLDIRLLGPEVGQGKGIKMVYGAFTKGLTAISTMLLMASREMGLYDALEALQEETMPLQRERMRLAVPSMPNRSRRWVSEMEEIAKTYRALGLTPKVYDGAAEFYVLVGGTPLGDERPETMDRSRSLKRLIDQLCDELL